MNGSGQVGPSAGLVFAIGSRLFALPLGSVCEVIRAPPITPIPGGPANVLGVGLAGGVVVTIFDLAASLAAGPSVRSEQSRVLLVRQPGELMGVMVDRVLGVAELEALDEAVASTDARPADAPLLLEPDRLFSPT